MLESYQQSMDGVHKQQFGPKQITSLTQSGRIGASTLASDVALDLALLGSNMDIKSLESFGVHPLTEEDIAKLREKVEKMRLVEEGDAQGLPAALVSDDQHPAQMHAASQTPANRTNYSVIPRRE